MKCCLGADKYIGFQGIESWDSVDFTQEVQRNLKLFLDYAFLKIGAWCDSTEENCDGINHSILNKLETPIQSDVCFWGSRRNQWVWEDIEHCGRKPIVPSILVDGQDMTEQFQINYPLGMITGPNSISGDVAANFSYRKVQTFLCDQAGWWHELINSQFGDNASAKSSIYSIFRGCVQPPAIIIEGNNIQCEAACLGSSAHWVQYDIILNVVAETSAERDKIVGILVQQKDNSLLLFNSDEVQFPIGCNGEILNNNNYPDLVYNTPWRCSTITQSGTASFESPCDGLYFGRVRLRFEIWSPKKPKIGV